MKKTTRKLMLRTETVRELSEQALSRVIGGQEADTNNAVPFSRERQCPAAAYTQSRDRQCPNFIVALDG